jgi:hypothetical protein
MTPAVQVKPSVRAFISYSSRDSALAESLRSAVEGDGILCFYAPADIKEREIWRTRLESEIGRADVILLLYTDAAANSDEVYKEIEMAHRLGKDIWMLKDGKAGIAARFQAFELGARYQAFQCDAGTELAAFERLKQSLDKRFGRIDLPSQGTIVHDANPYPGKPYTSQDQDFFFGRDAECNRLLSDIYDGEERIFFVYGPSGAGKSSLIDAGLRRLLSKRWWFSETISPSLERPDTMAVDMWRHAVRQLTTEDASERAESQLVQDIMTSIHDLAQSGYVFWFDHVERLLVLEDKRIGMFFRIAHDLLQRTERVRVIISFRRETLSQAEDQAERQLPKGSWRKWFLRGLTREGAFRSIVDPAKKKNGVAIDKDLASALVNELARGEYEDRDGKKIATVNPVSLQLVCGRLWDIGKPGLSSITGVDVRDSGAADVKDFVETALENHLDYTIEKIALSLKGGNLEQKKELIRLGLLQFVSEDRRRQQLKEEPDEKGTRVGRLQGDIVKGLYEGRLLQQTDIGLATPDYRYELVHDSLVDAIDHFRNKVNLLATLNTLESALRAASHDKAGLKGYFNRNADLLAELEDARREEAGFFSNEKEFLFRCAMGNQRTLAKKPVSLEGWARLLADGNVETFVNVLHEALSPEVGDDSVRRDAIGLLMQKEFRDRLTGDQLKELGTLIQAAALDGTLEVQQVASVAVCEISQPLGATELFDRLKDGTLRGKASKALVWVRQAADRREISDLEACRAFEFQWRGTRLPYRFRVLLGLWWQRTRRSFVWMFFGVVMATVLTAIGAALAFVPMGLVGAALTLADKSAGWAKGPFHGLAGGTFWGIGISSALMFYWVILRGGRVSPKLRNWIPAFLAASAGGFVAGALLALVVGFVFQQESLYSAGWLDKSSTAAGRLADLFWNTRHGWWPPILGAAVGAGVSWSLQNISADHRAEEFLSRHSGDILKPTQALVAIAKMLRLVFFKSWRILTMLALGGILVFAILRPGHRVCDPSDPQWDSSKPACDVTYKLAPLPARVGGIVLIMWAGGVFMEVGILFGIFAARTGVRLSRDERFLQAFPD